MPVASQCISSFVVVELNKNAAKRLALESRPAEDWRDISIVLNGFKFLGLAVAKNIFDAVKTVPLNADPTNAVLRWWSCKYAHRRLAK
jgi:hypothetical protein